jgi:hypothetical protein
LPVPPCPHALARHGCRHRSPCLTRSSRIAFPGSSFSLPVPAQCMSWRFWRLVFIACPGPPWVVPHAFLSCLSLLSILVCPGTSLPRLLAHLPSRIACPGPRHALPVLYRVTHCLSWTASCIACPAGPVLLVRYSATHACPGPRHALPVLVRVLVRRLPSCVALARSSCIAWSIAGPFCSVVLARPITLGEIPVSAAGGVDTGLYVVNIYRITFYVNIRLSRSTLRFIQSTRHNSICHAYIREKAARDLPGGRHA